MRIREIDIAKGIGIIFVVLGHLLSDQGGYLHDWIYAFHMPLFFILSGMTLSKKCSIGRLAYRLLIPYAIWSTIATVYELTQTPEIWKSVIVVNMINMISSYGIAPFWFLAALFTAEYLIVKLQKKAFVFPILAVLLTPVVLRLGSGVAVNAVKAIVRNLWAASFVLLGTYLTPLCKKNRYTILCVVLSLALSIVCSILNSGVNMQKLILGNSFLFIAGAVSGSVFMVQLSAMIQESSILEYLGKQSLGIMCIHYKTIPLWGIIMLLPLGNSMFSVCVQLLLLLSASLLITWLIKRHLPILLGGDNGKRIQDSTRRA